jgi:hypothetical protein
VPAPLRSEQTLTVELQANDPSGATTKLTVTVPANASADSIQSNLESAAALVASALASRDTVEHPDTKMRVIGPILDPSAPFTVATHAVHRQWIAAMLSPQGCDIAALVSHIGRGSRVDPDRVNKLVRALRAEGYYVECDTGIYYLRGRELRTGKPLTTPFDLTVAYDLATTATQRLWVTLLVDGIFQVADGHRARREEFVSKLRVAGYQIEQTEAGLRLSGFNLRVTPHPVDPEFDTAPALRIAGATGDRRLWLAKLLYSGLKAVWTGREWSHESEKSKFVIDLYTAGYRFEERIHSGYHITGFEPCTIALTEPQAFDLAPALEIASTATQRSWLARLLDPVSGKAPTKAPRFGAFINDLLDLGYQLDPTSSHITSFDPAGGQVRVLSRTLRGWTGSDHTDRIRALTASERAALKRLFDCFEEVGRPDYRDWLRNTLHLAQTIAIGEWSDYAVEVLVECVSWLKRVDETSAGIASIAATHHALEAAVGLVKTWSGSPRELVECAVRLTSSGHAIVAAS